MNKLVRRFSLGYLWEYAKNESWFSDMALKGLHLQSVNWLVTFEKGTPKKTKYRIEILEETPSQEQLDIYKEYGWDLVTNNNIFYIFSSPEELNASELQTDPIEQSFTFKMLNKQLKKSVIIITVAVLFISAFLYFQFSFDSEPYLNMIRRSTITTMMLTLACIYMLFESIRGYYVVRKIKNSLQNNIPLNHKQKWKLSYFLSSIIYILLIAMVLTAIFMPVYEIIKTDSYASPKTFDKLPIIKISDIEDTEIYDYYHDLVYDYSILSPVQYRIYESGYVDSEMQEESSRFYTSTSIHSRYYELTLKGLADGLLNDLIKRYYHEYQYQDELVEIENNKFDQLHVVFEEERKYILFGRLYTTSEESTKLIFASFDNKVIYIKYTGKADIEKLISLLEQKYDL